MIPKYTAGLTKFPTFAYRTENHEFLLLFNYPEESEPQEYIRQSYEYFKQRHNCTVFWGISRPCVGLSEFIFANKEALTALSFSLTDSHDDITVYSDQMFIPAENSYGCFYPQTAADLLIKGMKNHDTDLIHFILTVLEDENTRLHPFSSEQMIAGQMLALHNAVTATFFGLNPVKYGFLEQLFAFQQEIIGCQGNFEHYFSHLHDLCLSVSASLAGQRMSKKKELVQETADFILQNYADANLNLSGTAQHFQVSEGYLSSIFKEHAGICFAEYLEKCRIEKSCVLLSDTASTIEQIAEDVGYNSVYSYRRAFKRLFHISPSAYREQKLP
jgi:AraC-like DNA-binding protein